VSLEDQVDILSLIIKNDKIELLELYLIRCNNDLSLYIGALDLIIKGKKWDYLTILFREKGSPKMAGHIITSIRYMITCLEFNDALNISIAIDRLDSCLRLCVKIQGTDDLIKMIMDTGYKVYKDDLSQLSKILIKNHRHEAYDILNR